MHVTCYADESGIFMNASTSARMATCPSARTINTACSTSRSDVVLLPLRALTGLSVLRWLRCLLYTSDAADDTPCVDL
eukprot:7076280-Pyramimonas_sp.AAC.1